MKDIKLVLIVTGIISIAVALIVLLTNGFNTTYIFTVQWWGINFMYSMFLTIINSIYFRFINHKFEWKNQGLRRILIGAGGSIFVTMIGYMICTYVIMVLILRVKTTQEFLASQTFGDYVIPLLFTTIASLFFHAMYFYKALQEKKVTEQKIIAGTASAKFTALKNQLDPHFLFNSLNVLTSLIEENPTTAQEFTTSLSKVYRYVLEQKDKELVSVDDELKFATTYMKLLMLRFEDSIQIEIPTQSSNPDAKIVPLSLQILLENTIKHNIVNPAKPLLIRIYEEDGFLLVENNLQPKKILVQSSGMGLANIKQRFSLLTKREFLVYKSKETFTAKLPMLTKLVTNKNMDMTTSFENPKETKYKRAQERVQKIKEFYFSLMAYCIVIPLLVFINYRTTGFDLPWVWFPIIGWGLGLLFHAMDAFNYNPILGRDWEEKRIKKFIKESKNKGYE
ncbi:2TM domain-containing protein [Aquimarina sp. W85]|uniref:2TM domain-containing protein n=1 Tax=Aquimarina rhodophyticola TaxID=3342246 RepID=UPI003672A346